MPQRGRSRSRVPKETNDHNGQGKKHKHTRSRSVDMTGVSKETTKQSESESNKTVNNLKKYKLADQSNSDLRRVLLKGNNPKVQQVQDEAETVCDEEVDQNLGPDQLDYIDVNVNQDKFHTDDEEDEVLSVQSSDGRTNDGNANNITHTTEQVDSEVNFRMPLNNQFNLDEIWNDSNGQIDSMSELSFQRQHTSSPGEARVWKITYKES